MDIPVAMTESLDSGPSKAELYLQSALTLQRQYHVAVEQDQEYKQNIKLLHDAARCYHLYLLEVLAIPHDPNGSEHELPEDLSVVNSTLRSLPSYMQVNILQALQNLAILIFEGYYGAYTSRFAKFPDYVRAFHYLQLAGDYELTALYQARHLMQYTIVEQRQAKSILKELIKNNSKYTVEAYTYLGYLYFIQAKQAISLQSKKKLYRKALTVLHYANSPEALEIIALISSRDDYRRILQSKRRKRNASLTKITLRRGRLGYISLPRVGLNGARSFLQTADEKRRRATQELTLLNKTSTFSMSSSATTASGSSIYTSSTYSTASDSSFGSLSPVPIADLQHELQDLRQNINAMQDQLITQQQQMAVLSERQTKLEKLNSADFIYNHITEELVACNDESGIALVYSADLFADLVMQMEAKFFGVRLIAYGDVATTATNRWHDISTILSGANIFLSIPNPAAATAEVGAMALNAHGDKIMHQSMQHQAQHGKYLRPYEVAVFVALNIVDALSSKLDPTELLLQGISISGISEAIMAMVSLYLSLAPKIGLPLNVQAISEAVLTFNIPKAEQYGQSYCQATIRGPSPQYRLQRLQKKYAKVAMMITTQQSCELAGCKVSGTDERHFGLLKEGLACLVPDLQWPDIQRTAPCRTHGIVNESSCTTS